MGYYTSVTIVGAWPKDRPTFDKRTQEDIEEEENITSEIDSQASEINNLRDDNDPIKEISLNHKDWIIEVEGRGGDQEDLWRRRYLNGNYEHIAPVWPSYKTILDKNEMLNTQAGKDITLVNDVNEYLEKTNAVYRIVYKDGKFFFNQDLESGDNFEEISRNYVKWLHDNIKQLKQ